MLTESALKELEATMAVGRVRVTPTRPPVLAAPWNVATGKKACRPKEGEQPQGSAMAKDCQATLHVVK